MPGGRTHHLPAICILIEWLPLFNEENIAEIKFVNLKDVEISIMVPRTGFVTRGQRATFLSASFCLALMTNVSMQGTPISKYSFLGIVHNGINMSLSLHE